MFCVWLTAPGDGVDGAGLGADLLSALVAGAGTGNAVGAGADAVNALGRLGDVKTAGTCANTDGFTCAPMHVAVSAGVPKVMTLSALVWQ